MTVSGESDGRQESLFDVLAENLSVANTSAIITDRGSKPQTRC